jgi:hypothetical protein
MAEGEMPPEPRWLFYVLSFFVPVAGIVIGAIYMGKADADCRTFGKNCIIAAVALFGFFCIFYIVVILSLGVFESFRPGL